MTRALLIGDNERAAIAELIAKAEQRVTSLDEVKRSAAFRQRTGVVTNIENAPLTIKIPIGFHVCYTHEEQPGAVCRHMSISVANAQPNTGPNPHAVAVLMEEFGFKNQLATVSKWLDIDGDRLIVNVLEPLDGNINLLRKRDA